MCDRDCKLSVAGCVGMLPGLVLLPARSHGDVVTGAQRGAGAAGDSGQLRDAQ